MALVLQNVVQRSCLSRSKESSKAGNWDAIGTGQMQMLCRSSSWSVAEAAEKSGFRSNASGLRQR